MNLKIIDKNYTWTIQTISTLCIPPSYYEEIELKYLDELIYKGHNNVNLSGIDSHDLLNERINIHQSFLIDEKITELLK